MSDPKNPTTEDRHSAPASETAGAADPEIPEGRADIGDLDDAELAGQPSGRQASLWADAWRELKHNKMFVVAAFLIVVMATMAAFPQLFTSFYPGNPDPNSCSLSNSLQRPSSTHWFGFDLQGCDYYARTIYGARVSMIIGVTVTTFAVMIAMVFGTIAAYYGGFIDTVIARLTDIAFALPVILGGIVILSVFEDQGLFEVSLVLIALGWTTMLRLMRSSVLSTKEADYVDAARTLGASDFRIMLRHIIPNAISPVIVYATITVGVIISAEAALSFLGIGLQLPAISWGLMISVAQTRILEIPHLLVFPGIFLSVTVFSFILMGDALRDALDPKLR